MPKDPENTGGILAGPQTVITPTTILERGGSWPRTPAAVSIVGIAAVAMLEAIALERGLDGSHFYASLSLIGAICGIHMTLAPRLRGG